ncbi:MAG: glycosyltransferase [Actinobacteria bacterium]|nr:glycosyltransferase [Actinomycetota bacterium]
MRSQLRRFAAVGVLVTGVDVSVLVLLRLGLGLPVLLADAIAIFCGAAVSFFANRALTFTRDPHLRWVDAPVAYTLVTASAGLVDIAVVRAGLLFNPDTARVLLLSKAAALAIAGVVRVIGYRSLLFNQVRAVQIRPPANPTPAPGSYRFSVVIPAYKAESFIGRTVQRLRDELEPTVGAGELEIVIVDDGSSDDTFATAQASGADLVLKLPQNKGKGAAVRRGMLSAHGRTIAFTDADLAYEPALLLKLLEEIEQGWDVVVGSRGHIETVTLVRTGRLRSLGSRAINLISFAVLLGAYRDTQCGLKAFRSDAAQQIFSVARIDRFAFDIEVFHLAERLRLSLEEVPVTLTNSEGSTVRVGLDSLRVLIDMIRIRRLAGRGAYDDELSSSPQ